MPLTITSDRKRRHGAYAIALEASNGRSRKPGSLRHFLQRKGLFCRRSRSWSPKVRPSPMPINWKFNAAIGCSRRFTVTSGVALGAIALPLLRSAPHRRYVPRPTSSRCLCRPTCRLPSNQISRIQAKATLYIVATCWALYRTTEDPRQYYAQLDSIFSSREHYTKSNLFNDVSTSYDNSMH